MRAVRVRFSNWDFDNRRLVVEYENINGDWTTEACINWDRFLGRWTIVEIDGSTKEFLDWSKLLKRLDEMFSTWRFRP